MIIEPYKKIDTFDNVKLKSLIGSEKKWKNRGSRIATEVLYIPDDKFDSHVDALVEKYIRPLYDDFNYFYRIHKLGANTRILPHRDCEENIECLHVLHFIISTNENTFFTIGDKKVHMEEGSIYEINYSYEHHVENNGDSDRVHLLVELRCR